MKTSAVLLPLLLAFAAAQVAPEIKEKVKSALVECNKESKLPQEKVQKILAHEDLPADDKEKCFVGCVFKHLKTIVDNKFDVEESVKQNKFKYPAEDVPKADEMIRKCAEKIPVDAKNECDIAYEMLKCVKDEAKVINLSLPKY